MSTSATDLLERARHTLSDLQQSRERVTRQQWEAFDQTVYRLLHELVRARAGWHSADTSAVPLYRAFRDYPQPLQPVEHRADFSTTEAARFLGTTDAVVRRRIHAGTMLAAATGAGYRIPRTELAISRNLSPASTDDTHPLARLSWAFGALGDLLVTSRMQPSSPDLRSESAASIARQTLAITSAAARHTLALCEPDLADRPLAIARYAATSVERLPAAAALVGLQNPAVPPSGQSVNSDVTELERSIHQWTRTARDELVNAVPSVEVLKDIHRQGVHMCAALDNVLANAADAEAAHDARAMLKASAYTLQAAADAWAHTTTGASPSRAYVEASRRLYATLATLTHVTRPGCHQRPDAEPTYQALLRGASEAAWLASLTTSCASRLLSSEVLFVHARHTSGSPRRLNAKLAGRMVVATPQDVPTLLPSLWEAHRSAREVTNRLPPQVTTTAARQQEISTPEM